MATVHLARQLSDEGFSRVVAVKRLHAHISESAESLGMFLDEARLASRIRHSNVVPTLDVVSRNGELLIVMEYVLGESLSGLIREARHDAGGVPIPIAVRLAIDMLHGLHAAHEAKDERGQPLHIVHRDVSPQNVLVGVDGVARIVDFGIAKAAGRLQTTQNNKLKGKLAYMAPEQLERLRELDGRVDVYATGIVLWEMLVGRRLFRGEDEVDTFKKALAAQIPHPCNENSAVPPALGNAVMKALARRAEDRPDTASALASTLEELQIACSTAALSDWVKATASAAVSIAQARVAEIETAPAPGLSEDSSLPSWSDGSVRTRVARTIARQEVETDVIAGEAGSPITVNGPIETSASGKRGRRWAWVALLLLGGGALALFTLGRKGVESPQAENEAPGVVAASRDRPEAPAAPLDSSPRAEPPLPDQPEKPREVPSTDPKEGGEPPAREKAPAAAASPAVRSAARPAPPSKAAAPTDDCKNPFTVDEDGVKIPKVHCL